MPKQFKRFVILIFLCGLFIQACTDTGKRASEPDIPRGYMAVLEIEQQGRRLTFGPFVGYYFKPDSPDDLTRLSFICFNEQQFYTLDLPENTLLYKGNAVLARLSDTGTPLPEDGRITPVFFPDAPAQWLDKRPDPTDEYIHFHSAYNAQGAVRTGYWLRHNALKSFTYDMGGRVNKQSPLYHQVVKGVDKEFANIVEFDRGPGN